MSSIKVRRALLSVSDKTGIVELAKSLLVHGVEILSTGGTAQLLKINGVVVTEVADYTGFPEMMEGRVKTLHPKVHGGILARRDKPDHVQAMEEHDIPPIDMVVLAVEKPMLEVVMFQAHGNQTRAAELLGMNRNTLRKKLQQHGLD